MHRWKVSRPDRVKRRIRIKSLCYINYEDIYLRGIYFLRTVGISAYFTEKSRLSCSIAFNANYSKICHSSARVSLRIAGSHAGKVNLVIMSCVFFTKLRCSSERVKWLRLEQRPFNYFVARIHRVSHIHTHVTVYVRGRVS